VRDVRDKMTWLKATSVAGPAVAYSPARGVPVIAWRGNENSRNITLAYVVGPPGQLAATQLETHISEDATELAPALYYLTDNGLVLAWVGINDARTVNVAAVDLPAGSNRVDSRERVFVNGGGLGAGGAGPPSLSAFDPTPLSLACLNDAGELCLASAQSGLNFDVPDPVAWDAPCVEGVALSFLRAAWTRADDNRLEFIRFPLGPNARVPSAQSSLHRPSLAEYRGQLYVAWVGTEGNGHLNVAPIDSGAWSQGGDPIDANQVDTLTELSMAAPALLRLPADISGTPERLAIFWTGVDGTGLINGAVVYP
jgi:hypothetical protein